MNRAVRGLAAVVVATILVACGDAKAAHFEARNVDLKAGADGFQNTDPSPGGPASSGDFVPKFTLSLPPGWATASEGPGFFGVAAPYEGDGDPVTRGIFIYRLVGVIDDPYIHDTDFYAAAAKHTRPLPADVIGWLRSHKELTVVDLPARGVTDALARVTVDRVAPRRLDTADCDSSCLKLFVIGPKPHVTSDVIRLDLNIRWAYEVGMIRHDDVELLALIQSPREQMERFAPVAEAVLNTMVFE